MLNMSFHTAPFFCIHVKIQTTTTKPFKIYLPNGQTPNKEVQQAQRQEQSPSETIRYTSAHHREPDVISEVRCRGSQCGQKEATMSSQSNTHTCAANFLVSIYKQAPEMFAAILCACIVPSVFFTKFKQFPKTIKTVLFT